MIFSEEDKQHRIAFAQNYLKNPSLAAWLMNKCAISENEMVLEIGPGRGTLTRKLAALTSRVIAVEKDEVLLQELRRDPVLQHVEIIQADFLTWPLPNQPYKVFSNPPFNITSRIVKKLLWAKTPPTDAYLFTQKEAADRFLGDPLEFELSIASKPFFTYSIIHQFERTDFTPVPNVDVVLLHIHRAQPPLLDIQFQRLYRQFVHFGYTRQKKDALKDFEDIFSYEQWKRLAREHSFPVHAAIRDLHVHQWLALFDGFRRLVTEYKKQHLITSLPLE